MWAALRLNEGISTLGRGAEVEIVLGFDEIRFPAVGANI